MGKVIKGSADSEERYTLAVPSLRVSVPLSVCVEAIAAENDAEPESLALAPEAAVPEVDFAAAEAAAQQIVDDADRAAQALIVDAQVRARELVAEAETRARASAEATQRAAHDSGYADGVLAAQSEMAQLLETLRSVVESARNERQAIFRTAEPELVRLAVGIAERVLHQQIALDGGVVVEMAKAAIARLADRDKIVVRVNPADVDRMREHREELLALGDVRSMRVIEDQRVDRGGVILETDGGSIDAKISTQLTEARKILHIVDDVIVQPAPGMPLPIGDADVTALGAMRAS